MSKQLGDWEFWAVELTRLHSDFGALLISHQATTEKIALLERRPWFDPNLSHGDNKSRMKELGGAVFGYRGFLGRSVIHSIADILEHTWVEVRRNYGLKCDVWDPPFPVEFEKDARMVRAMANVLKHNQGVVEADKSKHAAFLVRECGIPEGVEIETLVIANRLDLPDLIYRGYIYSLDLVTKVSGQDRRLLEVPEPGRKAEVLDFLVPPILGEESGAGA